MRSRRLSNDHHARPHVGPSTLPRGLRLLLKVIGLVLVPIGVAGVFLPILPGVPLLILAAACFARSSPRLEHWLVKHPRLGPGIVAWRERGAISLKSKMISIPVMALSGAAALFSDAPTIAKAIAVTSLTGAALFVVTRPNR